MTRGSRRLCRASAMPGGFRNDDRRSRGAGPIALQNATNAMMSAHAQTPGVAQVFSLFETQTPQIYLDIDRNKAQLLGINMPDVFYALQAYIGSIYVNDFNLFGRTFRVQSQAAAPYRLEPQDVLEPAGAQLFWRDRTAWLVHHHPGHFRPVSRATLQHLSCLRTRWCCRSRIFAGSGDRDHGEDGARGVASRALPSSGPRWRSSRSGRQYRGFAFTLGVIFVFLVLAAQFESLTLPLAIISDCADVSCLGDHRCADPRSGQ